MFNSNKGTAVTIFLTSFAAFLFAFAFIYHMATASLAEITTMQLSFQRNCWFAARNAVLQVNMQNTVPDGTNGFNMGLCSKAFRYHLSKCLNLVDQGDGGALIAAPNNKFIKKAEILEFYLSNDGGEPIVNALVRVSTRKPYNIKRWPEPEYDFRLEVNAAKIKS